jgi:hypothetical protein
MCSKLMLDYILRMLSCDESSSVVFAHTFSSQIFRGPNPFERNMGMLRLSAVERGSAQSSQAGVDLMSRGTGVDLYHKTHIWYGTIFIGTPPKSFNGKLLRAFVTPIHSSRYFKKSCSTPALGKCFPSVPSTLSSYSTQRPRCSSIKR